MMSRNFSSVRTLARSLTARRLSFPVFKRTIANQAFFEVSPAVKDALANKQPVVALETTIYTHGWPFPDNLKLAQHLEGVVRANGAVPATIGVLGGIAHVGMNSSQLQELLERPGARKISRRDLAFVTGSRLNGQRIHGGTTISGTMILARLAGIKVFGTGGLGGVHRGGESSMDISADLTELGRTPVAVIAAGCKGFLDIPRTLEYLETQGVAVMTFAEGRQGVVDFPAFWSRDSGVPSPFTIENEAEAAAIINAQFSLGIDSGLFFASPVPAEASISREELERIIEEAISRADQAGASGSANTPFILQQIKELSHDRSVTANRALIESNIARAAKVATELSKLEQTPAYIHQGPITPVAASRPQENKDYRNDNDTDLSMKGLGPPPPRATVSIDLLVAGALAGDLSCDFDPSTKQLSAEFPVLGTSNPCAISQSFGGVAYNVARAAHLMGASVKLLAAVSDDLTGMSALQSMALQGMDTSGVHVFEKGLGARTARYIAVNDSQRNLVFGLADMDILEMASERFDSLWKDQIQVHAPKWLVIDANWNAAAISKWLAAAREGNVRTAFEPVSTTKAQRLFHSNQSAKYSLQVFPNNDLHLSTPNSQELNSMYRAAHESGLFERQDWWEVIDAFNIPATGARQELVRAVGAELVDAGVPQQSIQLLPLIPCLITKLGHKGVLLTMLLSEDDERLRSAEAATHILSISSSNARRVGGVYLRLFPPAEVVDADISSVNGVGDTFLGALMARMVKTDSKVEDLIDTALRAAVLTLKSMESVSPDLVSLK